MLINLINLLFILLYMHESEDGCNHCILSVTSGVISGVLFLNLVHIIVIHGLCKVRGHEFSAVFALSASHFFIIDFYAVSS